MKKVSLTKGAIAVIHKAIDALFDKAVARFIGRPVGDKRIYITAPRVTLASLFESASAEEHARADENVLSGLIKIAVGYVDAQREAAKAKVTKAVSAWLFEAYAKGVETDVETVLGGELEQIWGSTTNAMARIVDTEASNAKNTGILDGVIRVNAAMGIEDPVVYFVVVRDQSLCSECKRLHLLDNETTPRLWYLSEVGHGYHKKGQQNPKLGGLHPLCRCQIITLMPGYGFDATGMITYVSPDHDEIAKQR